MASSNYTPETWATTVLRGLGYQPKPGAVQALVGWAKAEGGHWNNDAKYNPLNTTQPEPGAGNTGSQGNIKVYKNWDQGVQATVATLKNGRYGSILQGLRAGDPTRVADAIGKTPWGTSGDLVKRTILGTRVSNVPASPSQAAPAGVGTTTTTTTPGVDNSGLRRQLVANFLQQGGVKNTAATSAFATGIRGAQDVAGTTTTTSSPHSRLDPATATVSGPGVKAITDRADKLNADKRPYLWGGGHGGDSWGLDCSGAVSQALGVDVRVASQFEKFGKPGPGKNVTIYAKDSHVLMEVDGHFWGTSQTNPNGGPGWIPRSALPASYLKNFVARHPDGM